MAGGADGQTDSKVIFDAEQRHDLVVKGCAQHTCKDYGCRGQRRDTAERFGNVDSDRRGDGLRNQRNQHLLAGAERFAAEVNDEDGCQGGDGYSAGDGSSLLHDNLAVFI